jgi:hypothetical protein
VQQNNDSAGTFYFDSIGLDFVCFIWFMCFDVFKFLHLTYFFFTYLCFHMVYPAHVCTLDMDECLHASLVYLLYIALECTHMEALG